MRIKGVNYDVGSEMGTNWRPDYDPKIVERNSRLSKTICIVTLSVLAVKTLVV